MMKSRIAWIDLLETIAIFLVILCHNSLYTINISSPDAAGIDYLRYFLRIIQVIGVPLFFVINGYLLFSKPFDLKRHLRKTIHFTIITFIWGAISLLVLNHFRFESLQSFFSVKGDLAYLWFMGALVVVYLIFPLLKLAYDKAPKYLLYFTIICAIFTFGNTLLNELATLFSAGIMHRPTIYYDVNFFWMFNPFQGIKGYVFLYFCLGGLLYHYRDNILKIPTRKRNISGILGMIIGMVGLFLVGLLYSKTSGNYWDIIFNGYDTIFALLLTCGAVLLALNFQSSKHLRLNHLLATVSSNTLGIYFIHVIPIFLSIGFLRTIPAICNIGGTLLYGLVILLLSLIISLIMHKIPLLKKLVK